MLVRMVAQYPKEVTSVVSKLRPLAISENPAARNKRRTSMATKDDLDNHADQLNPNNDAYWESRGWDGRPDDWEDRQDSGDLLPAG